MAADRPDVSRVWASGSPNNIIDPDTRQPNKVVKGWEAEIPPFEYFNWIQYNNDLFKLALVERGISSWGDDVYYTQGALSFNEDDGRIYIAQKVSKGQKPTNNPSYWLKSAIQITQNEIDAIKASIENHKLDKNNPHHVTAKQIGAYDKEEANGLIDHEAHLLIVHEEDHSNPHKVTAAQAGGVPITGGTYTGQVNTTATAMHIGKGKTPQRNLLNTLDDRFQMIRDKDALGVHADGYAFHDKGGVINKLVPEQDFAALKLLNEPKYAVPRPDFWMPLKNDINIYEGDGIVTFGRDSTATYIDKQGYIRVASENQPRFEKEGLLVERTATNYANCKTTSNHGLHKDGGGTFGDLPYVTYTITNPSDCVLYSGNPLPADLPVGTVCTQSAILRIPDKDVTIRLFSNSFAGHVVFNSEGIVNVSSEVLHHSFTKLADGFIKVTNTVSKTSSADSNLHLWLNESPNINGKVFCDFVGIQYEVNLGATSLIYTSGTPVTRAKDTIQLPMSQRPNDTNCTVHLTTKSLFPLNSGDNSNGAFGLNRLGRNTIIESEDGHFVMQVGGGGNIKSPNKSNIQQKYVWTANQRHYVGYIDGKSIGTATTEPASSSQAFLLGEAETTWILNGHITDLRIWNTPLTPEQVSTL